MTLLNNLEQFISLNNYRQSDIPRGFAAQVTRLFARQSVFCVLETSKHPVMKSLVYIWKNNTSFCMTNLLVHLFVTNADTAAHLTTMQIFKQF